MAVNGHLSNGDRNQMFFIFGIGGRQKTAARLSTADNSPINSGGALPSAE
jgi:hypothetical protein